MYQDDFAIVYMYAENTRALKFLKETLNDSGKLLSLHLPPCTSLLSSYSVIFAITRVLFPCILKGPFQEILWFSRYKSYPWKTFQAKNGSRAALL